MKNRLLKVVLVTNKSNHHIYPKQLESWVGDNGRVRGAYSSYATNHEPLKSTPSNSSNVKGIDSYFDFIYACAKAGLTAVQLREKNLPYNDLLQFGRRLQTLLQPFQIPLIVNDNCTLCLELDAEGLHLGQADGDVSTARKVLGSKKVIGLTVNNPSQIELANNLPIDYIGVGAIFPTQNKSDVQMLWGSSGLKHASSLSVHPIVAIGGINESNAAIVMESGATGIAAIGAFHEAINPEITTRTLRKIVDGELAS